MAPAAQQVTLSKALGLRLRFPLRTIEPTDDQRSQIAEVKAQLAGFTFVSGLHIYQVANEIGLKCRIAAPASTEDGLLSYVFLETRCVWEDKPLFTQGFCDERPAWEALKGDFVADQGAFALRVAGQPSA